MLRRTSWWRLSVWRKQLTRGIESRTDQLRGLFDVGEKMTTRKAQF